MVFNNGLLFTNKINDMNEKQAEVNDLIKSISRLTIYDNSDSRIWTYPNINFPNKNQYTEYNNIFNFNFKQ